MTIVLVINDIIDFSKISAGSVEVIRNTFILQDMVTELVTLFSESMAKDGVEFDVDISGIDKSAFGDGSRLMLLGDDAKIRRIVINMLSNVRNSFSLIVALLIKIHPGLQIHSQRKGTFECYNSEGFEELPRSQV